MTNGNEPAFINNGATKGLTKREYFATMAMQGILANSSDGNVKWDYDIIGQHCVKAADALITQLNKPTTND